MLFLPKWVRGIPPPARPDEARIRAIETFRKQHRIPHEPMFLKVVGSATTTRKIQRHIYLQMKAQQPTASENDLLAAVLVSRLAATPPVPITEAEFDSAMEQINSFDDLCDFIITLDKQEPAGPDPLGWGKAIDDILASERGTV